MDRNRKMETEREIKRDRQINSGTEKERLIEEETS